MNSGAKPMKRVGAVVWFALFAFGLIAFLAAGCADHGPTNLYSNPLFGQNQSGATLQLWRVQEFSLSTTAGAGPDQYVIEIKNTGPGGVLGPITAQVSLAPACAGTYMESYAGVTQTPTQTVVFGTQGQAIDSNETLWGSASNMSGPYQYSVQTAFPGSCADSTDTFNVTMTDGKGDQWTGSFSGTNQ
jgi:hypothetical protein